MNHSMHAVQHKCGIAQQRGVSDSVRCSRHCKQNSIYQIRASPLYFNSHVHFCIKKFSPSLLSHAPPFFFLPALTRL